jgi:LmbE family N-acetylglucosaminyl deacetylase
MRLDADAPVLLLSPHLDDAVLSCWSVLTGSREVVVVNVFSGIPEPGLLIPVDRMAGASDSATRMRERLAEDAEALALAGHEPIDLGFLDSQYRPLAGEPGAAEIVAALDGPVERASALFAPAGLSGNPDHLVVRELALGLAARGYPTELYAEFPAAIRYGWPHWVTGDDPDPHLVPDIDWPARLPDPGATGIELHPRSVRLDEAQADGKLHAMRTYRTQYPLLTRGPIDRLGNERNRRHELFWQVRPTA